MGLYMQGEMQRCPSLLVNQVVHEYILRSLSMMVIVASGTINLVFDGVRSGIRSKITRNSSSGSSMESSVMGMSKHCFKLPSMKDGRATKLLRMDPMSTFSAVMEQ